MLANGLSVSLPGEPGTESARLLAACELPSFDGCRRALAVTGGERGEFALVPLVERSGQWERAAPGDGVAAALVRALASGATLAGGFRLQAFGASPVGTGERAITADQTNQSVVVGERLVVKWLRHSRSGNHPAAELRAHLTEVGFTAIPRPYGDLSWVSPDGDAVTLAFVDEFLPGADDGWTWCVDILLAHLGHGTGRCPPDCEADFPARLGALVADLHVALATPSTVLPVPTAPASSDQIADWSRQAHDHLAEALRLTDGEDGAFLASRTGQLTRALKGVAHASSVPLQRIHGDLHVGQVLRWSGGLAVIDFDGNPAVAPAEATRLQPAARDVAQMLRSLDHVGRIASRRTDGRHTTSIERWIGWARDLFLDAYHGQLTRHGQASPLDQRLLFALEVEQECRELVYAARFLPRWRYAPMAALRSMFPDPDPELR